MQSHAALQTNLNSSLKPAVSTSFPPIIIMIIIIVIIIIIIIIICRTSSSIGISHISIL